MWNFETMCVCNSMKVIRLIQNVYNDLKGVLGKRVKDREKVLELPFNHCPEF